MGLVAADLALAIVPDLDALVVLHEDLRIILGQHAEDLGDGRVLRPNRSEPERLFSGLTLVGKQARVPARARIGRNCRIDPNVTEADYPRRRVAAGDTVVHAG